MEDRFTPGPWEANPGPYVLNGSDDGPNFSGGDWEVLPPLGERGPVAICSTQANARLSAASTDLLQWLNVILDSVDYTSGACRINDQVGAVLDASVIESARSAIAKAITAPQQKGEK